MHSYSNLWEKFIDPTTIRTAIRNGIKGKSNRDAVKKIIGDPERYADKIYEYATHFKSKEHDRKLIIDGPNGKQREIIVPQMDEHIVHHMVVLTLMDLFLRGMYDHTYASIPGRGMHQCRKKIAHCIKYDPKNTTYALKMDIRKFFNNIDHDILKQRFHKCIKDKRMLKVIYEIIDATDEGIPLGYYTSHWFANWFLQPLDHYIKEELGAKYYFRYMDDMVIFGPNKKKLHRMKSKIAKWLKDNKLKLKHEHQVFPISYRSFGDSDDKESGRPLDFIGFKFYRNAVILRKSLLRRITRKARKISKKGKFTIHDAYQLMSYLGCVEWSETFNIYKKYVSPVVTFKKCRKRISKYNKAQSEAYKKLEKALSHSLDRFYEP